jgi:hypothetical protein
LDTYGQAQMAALITTLAAGESYDDALTDVYGFNTDGLETEWRQAIGAAPRTIPPTPTPVSAEAIPTIAPAAIAQSMPTPEVYPTYAVETVQQPDETTSDLFTIFATLAILACCAVMLLMLFAALILSIRHVRRKRGVAE